MQTDNTPLHSLHMMNFMNIHVILSHPNPSSYNHAIAKTAMDTLKEIGHNVVFHDHYAEKFNPVLGQTEMQTTLTDPVVRRHCEELSNANGLLIIHPKNFSLVPIVTPVSMSSKKLKHTAQITSM
jgi:NAD(P)H dehydrogenase (quinone)